MSDKIMELPEYKKPNIDSYCYAYTYVPLGEKYEPALKLVGTFIVNADAKMAVAAKGCELFVYNLDYKRFDEICTMICNPEDRLYAEINNEWARFPINLVLASMIVERYREHFIEYNSINSERMALVIKAIDIMRKHRLKFNTGNNGVYWGIFDQAESTILNSVFGAPIYENPMNIKKLQIAEFVFQYSNDLDYLAYEDRERLRYTYEDSLSDTGRFEISRCKCCGEFEISLENVPTVLANVLGSVFPDAVFVEDGKYIKLKNITVRDLYTKYPILMIEYLNTEICDLRIENSKLKKLLASGSLKGEQT